MIYPSVALGEDPLRVDEAVPLASAMVAAVARSHGIRALVFKGESLAAYHLREPKTSMDVDVLIDPPSFEMLVGLLKQRGWEDRQERFPHQTDAPHSRTMLHAAWPCDLDLHRFFPGFLGDPRVTFETLWARRRALSIAHFECEVPDEPSSVLILVLNEGRARNMTSKSHVVRSWINGQSAARLAEIHDLAYATGCELTAGYALADMAESTAQEPVDSHEAQARLLRAMTGDHGINFLLMAFRTAPLRTRIRGGIALALLPVRAGRGRLGQRLKRLGRIRPHGRRS